MMKILIAGGGTGGHVIPALAIAREVVSRYGAEVDFAGTARGIEAKLVPQSGFKLHLIEVGALNKVSMRTRLKTALKLPRALFSALALVEHFEYDVVVGVGGYASGPCMAGAVLARVPTLAFEPNLVPGMANRFVARFVTAAAVHFEETASYFRNARVTGVPVRAEFFQIAAKRPGAERVLLVTGGSQGARALNRAVLEAVTELYAQVPGLRVVHQTGERTFEEFRAEYAAMGSPVEVIPFVQDMAAAFAQADLILCRSGASTVAEVAAAGKAAVFVPFPHAADDHQTRNAQAFVERGAALLVPEAQLTGARLVETISPLMNDAGRLAQMGAAARTLAHPNAATEIAEMIAALAEGKK